MIIQATTRGQVAEGLWEGGGGGVSVGLGVGVCGVRSRCLWG